MRGFRRGRWAAVAGFVLVFAVVLGGMSWATASTWQLAKINVEREHHSKISKAVLLMDTYMSSILGEQMGYPFTDYMPYYTDEPVKVWLGKSEVEADRVVLRSPIVKAGKRHEWISVYFQVDEAGNWSSPEYPCHCQAFEGPLAAQPACSCAHASLEWLARALPVADLGERTARARLRDIAVHTSGDRSTHVQNARPKAPAMDAEASRPHAPRAEYHRRMQRKRAAQMRSLPPTQCVKPEGETDNIADIVTGDRDFADSSELASVGIDEEEWASFWLWDTDGEPPKLAFVRTGTWDAQLVYQGFIADWSLLKSELLGEITHIFTDADLEPVPGDAPPTPEVSEFTMNTIPVRLSIPDLSASTTTGHAWKAVGSVLMITWMAAAAVLAVAGLGFRNLIALTERRMQFAYAVTHELRTPLTTFRLYSDMLSAGLVPSESRQEYLDTLNRESLRLSNLVEGVLEYARLENHKVALNPVAVDAGSLLKGIAEGFEKRCKECGIEPRMHNAVTNGTPLRTDVDVVNRITGVLINNACRHTQGAESPVVVVSLAQDNGRIHLDVIDSGSGIDHRDARTIFKPFRRGHRADSTAQGGIGLGLALARSWARLLGGQLDLIARHHRELGGAHFRLTIPAES
ncbi:MAG: sensor histidine kinase [Phycisphaerae bacterium]